MKRPLTAETETNAVRIDVITIFPEYLAPLELSLMGKAQQKGLIDLHVHNLRDFTHDRHNTVDDTPAGGGAGMVMLPQPWAEAFAHVLTEGGKTVVPGANGEACTKPEPLVIFPNPAGQPFKQATAQSYSEKDWLIFACGRYEGIDERVYEYLADLGIEVQLASLGDYVLNGGEVAVLTMTEAIVRLVPGVLGNPESVVDESHSDGLLEYPLYTKPAAWTDPNGVVREVPEVLLSGDHGKVAVWRAEAALERTRQRRPDLYAAYQQRTCREL